MRVKQTPQVDVDARGNHLAEVEMKRMHFHGIDIRIIINEIRSPRLDDLPQFTVKVITEQGAVAPAVRSPSSGHRRAASRHVLPESLGLLYYSLSNEV